MLEARYRLVDGRTLVVEYSSEGPCRMCGEPVKAASVGGTDVCPWCDMGRYRDGSPRSSYPEAKPAPTQTLDLENLPAGFRLEGDKKS